MPFAANEILVMEPIKKNDSSALSSIKSQVSTKLGEKLQKEYAWTRPVPIKFADVEKLFAKLKVTSGLKYVVTVDPKVKKIDFVVQDGTKKLQSATLLKDLDKIIKQAEVINLQGADGVMQRASSKQAKKFNQDQDAKSTYNDPRAGKAQVDEDPTDLSKINKHQKIILCGHGGGSDVGSGYVANKFGGRSADDIYTFLKDEGLSKSYSGTIYLSGCHTAAGFTDPDNFAKKVRDLLAKKGYKKLSVAGTSGVSRTDDQGDKSSTPAALDKDLQKTVNQTKKLVNNLKQSKDATDKEVALLETQVALAKAEFDGAVDLTSDIPPEAISTIKRTLLDPLEQAYKDLRDALVKVKQSQTIITKAHQSEVDYLDKLEDLLDNKAKYEAHTLSKADYRNKQKSFDVNEWWGVFGPAQKSRKGAESALHKLKKPLSLLKTRMAGKKAK